jgi:hypothetical protein
MVTETRVTPARPLRHSTLQRLMDLTSHGLVWSRPMFRASVARHQVKAMLVAHDLRSTTTTYRQPTTSHYLVSTFSVHERDRERILSPQPSHVSRCLVSSWAPHLKSTLVHHGKIRQPIRAIQRLTNCSQVLSPSTSNTITRPIPKSTIPRSSR